jgi:hypothetical protein
MGFLLVVACALIGRESLHRLVVGSQRYGAEFDGVVEERARERMNSGR